MKGAHVEPGARDSLMGHRPKDTKAMNYEVNELVFLYAEICKLPSLDSALFAATKPESPTNGSNPAAAIPRTTALVADLVTEKMHASGASPVSPMISAEEKGFEPLEPLRVRRFSKPLPSTTRPLLQVIIFTAVCSSFTSER
jgi:hypothetical protein